MKIWRLAFAMLAAFSLSSCSSDDNNEDKVEQVTVYVSAETGVYYEHKKKAWTNLRLHHLRYWG